MFGRRRNVNVSRPGIVGIGDATGLAGEPHSRPVVIVEGLDGSRIFGDLSFSVRQRRKRTHGTFFL
jgi:hypothetical protein